MKICSCPDGLPTIEYDFNAKPGDPNHWEQREKAHQEALLRWLKANGYGGKNTGRVAQFGVADGYAQYMLAEPTPGNGGQSILIHLPYGDAYHYQGVEYMPKKAILEEIERREKLAALFSKSVKESV